MVDTAAERIERLENEVRAMQTAFGMVAAIAGLFIAEPVSLGMPLSASPAHQQ